MMESNVARIGFALLGVIALAVMLVAMKDILVHLPEIAKTAAEHRSLDF